MKCIKLASRCDGTKINSLRLSEFQRSNEFVLLKPEKLLWNHYDEEHIVLVAWDADRAVATMRAVVVRNFSEAEFCLECKVPSESAFPAMIFNAAATAWDYRKIGLNQALRYHLLKIAKRVDIQTIFSPIYLGAPRIAFMRVLGYVFVSPEASWQDKLMPKSQRTLGILNHSKFNHAIALLEQQRSDIIQSFPYRGESVEFDPLAIPNVAIN